MLFERLTENITETVIIVEAADFRYDPKPLEGFIVQFVD